VLLIAHRLQSAQRADRIVVLRRGKIVSAAMSLCGGLYVTLAAAGSFVNGEGA
jgi:ABC-type multidrug transport system fused ATPase/permease subunit